MGLSRPAPEGVGTTKGEPYRVETGGLLPPPRRPHPWWRYPHDPLYEKMPGEKGEVSPHPRTRLLTGYRHALPPLQEGGGGRRPGGVGATDRAVRGRDRGGERSPPPRQPLPRWRYSHGPVHGETGEENRVRLPAGYRDDCPCPGGGGGGAPEARAGWGLLIEPYVVETGVGLLIEPYAIETGEEAAFPPCQPHPPMPIPPRSTVWGNPGEEPCTAAHRHRPCSGRGRGRSTRRRGWSGGYQSFQGVGPA